MIARVYFMGSMVTARFLVVE
ncbi:Protein of unknown function [Lactobacillus helveticus CIRM-BIA 101]|uniref:Uncharacterized protein n=1 Tax=Lactobacillus helveticus CIRM-BIA 953 TaxID=1226335 RepID=U4QHM5_LACHE|nr:Protein of unknown function [Lactobacillus helveticus CIRM-BIA 953]CDI64791.1 Protein of unknown function [Lactobacillus helveticus CIRM-BIA 101]